LEGFWSGARRHDFLLFKVASSDNNEPIPMSLFWLNHALKVAGGAIGAFVGGTWVAKRGKTTC
jgi:hypothetical protein